MPQFDPAAPFVLLDDASSAAAICRLYVRFVREDVVPAGEVGRLDGLLQEGWEKGWHACVLAPYEFGAPLVGVPSRAAGNAVTPLHDGAMRILWFASMTLCNAGEVGRWLGGWRQSAAPSGAMNIRSDTDRATFDAAISQIHDWIVRGHSYQVRPDCVLCRLAVGAAGAIRGAGPAAG
jgi:para-aminobenzoate synthetase/4-amino-4-deoxychorismate lyase